MRQKQKKRNYNLRDSFSVCEYINSTGISGFTRDESREGSK